MKQKRTKKIVWTIALGLVVAGLLTGLIVTTRANAAYRQTIYESDSSAFYGFMEDVDTLSTNVAKLTIGSTSEMGQQLLAETWKSAGEACAALANVNMSQSTKESLMAFINRVGDYAGGLVASLSRGNALTEEDIAQIIKINTALTDINIRLQEAWESGYTPDIEIDTYLAENTLTDMGDFTSQEYPRLIYDGAYSESMEKEPVNLSMGEISSQKAQVVAEEFLGIPLTYQTLVEGQQPYYLFAGETEQGPVEISITAYGGMILSFHIQVETDGLDILPSPRREKNLLAAAKEYLASNGWPECESGYLQYYGGKAVINMVPIEQDTRIYPDIIKVWVDVDTNGVVGLDATNYVSSHKERTYPADIIPYERAAGKVAQYETTRWDMAVIPRENGQEVYCYELYCGTDAQPFLVYVNAQSGEVEDILEVVHVNNGTLTK